MNETTTVEDAKETEVKPTTKPLPEGIPEPYPGEVIMWQAVAKACRKRKNPIMEKRCRVMFHDKVYKKFYWRAMTNFLGAGTTRDKSPHIPVTSAIATASDGNLLYIVMDEELFAKRAPKPRRCEMERMVSQRVIDMLQSSPTNSMFRSSLMAEVLEMPPAEADTFGKLRDWVEYTFPKEHLNPAVQLQPLVCNGVEYTEREVGHCKYTKINRWGGTVNIPVEQLSRMARASVNDTEFRNAIRKYIQSECEAMPLTYDDAYPYDLEPPDTTDQKSVHYPFGIQRDVYLLLRKFETPAVLLKFGQYPDADNPHATRTPAPAVPIDVFEDDDHDDDREREED